MKPRLSVILIDRQSKGAALARTRQSLARQTLPSSAWEMVLIDAGSPVLPLTAARLQGIGRSAGEVLALLDEGAFLQPDYLERAADALGADPSLGLLSGRSLPEFAEPPAAWVREFDRLLELRDLGDRPLRVTQKTEAPRLAPLAGSGLVLSRAAAASYEQALAREPARIAFGDDDLLLSILEAGHAAGYDPALVLTRLVPPDHVERARLGRLNRAQARQAVRVLAGHGLCPWSALGRLGVPFCQAGAWLRAKAWRGPAEWVRWQGWCGQFEGRSDLA